MGVVVSCGRETEMARNTLKRFALKTVSNSVQATVMLLGFAILM